MEGFMTWLSGWWDGLNLIEQILYCIAIPSTLLLLLETIFMIIGAGHGGEASNPSDTSGIDFDSDTDIGGLDGDFHFGGGLHFDGDGCPNDVHTDFGHDISHDLAHSTDHDSDVGNPSDMPTLKLFTIQGMVAFMSVFGWLSLACYHQGVHIVISVAIGFAAGFAVMYAIAKVFQSFKKMVQSGTLDYHNALGAEGTAYIPIPPRSQGNGKVNIVIQGSLRECDAVADGEEMIPTGAPIRVIDVSGGVLVVEKIS